MDESDACLHNSDVASGTSRLFSCVSDGAVYAPLLLHAGYERHPENRLGVAPHYHDVYHITLYLKGNSVFHLNGKTLQVTPGLLVLTSPGDIHSFGPLDCGWIEYREVTFELRSATRMLQLPFHDLIGCWLDEPVRSRNLPVQLSASHCMQMTDILKGFEKLLAERPNWHRLVEAGLFLSLTEFLAKNVFGTSATVEPLETRVDRVRRYLEINYREPITMQRLARMAGVSAAYLSRCFKARFGYAPIDYLIDQRVTSAKDLIQNTDLTFRVIAELTGFGDEYYFSRVIRQRTGSSPSRFRQKTN
jgi:AraC-like DNA-binding protein